MMAMADLPPVDSNMIRLVLLRHGSSVWNLENRFTGWTDVDLAAPGAMEAEEAGLFLKTHGFRFEVCYTSFLKRAIKTLWLLLETMDCMWVPVHKTWQLNERHYGGLQGRNKDEVAREFGAEQVFAWRRSFDMRPPPVELTDPRHPVHDPRYAHVDRKLLPAAESLRETSERVLPYWHGVIEPEVRKRRCVMICAHGNSLRALVKHLERIPEAHVPRLEIPLGAPLIYELDEQLKPITKYQAPRPGKPRLPSK